MTGALLVDLGRVLVGFDHQITVDRLVAATGVPGERLRPVLFGDLEAEFDRGRLAPEEFFRACEGRAGLPRLDDALWVGAWRDIFRPIPGALAALRRVRGDVRRILVSNTNVLHWEGVRSVCDLRGLLDAEVLSFRVGAVKPEPAFWDAALEAAGCEPGRCVYADDRQELVAAAAARGIPGFVVSGDGALEAGLDARGLTRPAGEVRGNSGAGPGVPLSCL